VSQCLYFADRLLPYNLACATQASNDNFCFNIVEGVSLSPDHERQQPLAEQKENGSGESSRATIGTKRGTFSCKFCVKTFAFEKNLLKHTNVHHSGEKHFCCALCDKMFTHKRNLNRHVAKVHNNKPFGAVCVECVPAIYFVDHNARRKHMQECHEQEEFQCADCTCVFTKKSQATRHLRESHGFKRFQCTQCKSAFTTKYSLHKHVESVHGDKMFSCCNEWCTKKFSTKWNMQQHVKLCQK